MPTLRRFKGPLLLAVAGMLAILTAFLVRGAIYSERANARVPVVEVPVDPQTYVLVAAQDLMPGQFVKPDRLCWQAWPDEALAESYVVKGERPAEDFSGAVVRTRLPVGAPVTEGQIVRPGDQGFLAAVLTPGNRAVSVPVSATTGIAGFIFPGDRVDLILSHSIDQGSDQDRIQRKVSETVLRDIRVLAIDQRTEEADGKPQIGKTATLEVNPRQAEMVAVVEQVGRLSLSLRSLATEEKDGNEDEAGANAEMGDGQDPAIADRRREAAEQRRAHARRSEDAAYGPRVTWDSDVSRAILATGVIINVVRADKAEQVALGGGH